MVSGWTSPGIPKGVREAQACRCLSLDEPGEHHQPTFLSHGWKPPGEERVLACNDPLSQALQELTIFHFQCVASMRQAPPALTMSKHWCLQPRTHVCIVEMPKCGNAYSSKCSNDTTRQAHEFSVLDHDQVMCPSPQCPTLALNSHQSVYIKTLIFLSVSSIRSWIPWDQKWCPSLPMPKRVPERCWLCVYGVKISCLCLLSLKKLGFPNNKCSLFQILKLILAFFGGGCACENILKCNLLFF